MDWFLYDNGIRPDAPNHCLFRSSRSKTFFKIGTLKNFANFHKKTLVLESLFNKVAGLRA